MSRLPGDRQAPVSTAERKPRHGATGTGPRDGPDGVFAEPGWISSCSTPGEHEFSPTLPVSGNGSPFLTVIYIF